MKKIYYLVIIFVCFFSCITNTLAYQDIKSINMDVYVDNNGDAYIKEYWNMSLNEGTEIYKTMYDMGESKILNYQVSMNGKDFQTIDNWDVNASFDTKSYKAGINIVKEGYELCFGISSYGTNQYVMSYTITNFVSRTTDADMIYWQLIPPNLSDSPDKIYIKVHSDFLYDKNWNIWGFGYGSNLNEGYAYINDDGYIEITKEGKLKDDEYVILLAKFPVNTFNLSNYSKLPNDFNYYLDMATSDSKNYHNSFLGIIISFIRIIMNFLPYIIFLIVIFAVANKNDFGTYRVKIKKNKKELKNAPYFRDLPCNKNIFQAYWVAGQYGLVKNNTDFLGAILLKWLKDGNVVNENKQTNKKNEKALRLVSSDNLSELEKNLYNMMLEASKDGLLENNEFTKWCRVNYKNILNWFNKIVDAETLKFAETGALKTIDKGYRKEYEPTEMMTEEAYHMAGLKNFLNEFSNIKDRESIEVSLWEEYLMYAQIFGIAEKVAKEFKKLYPDVITAEVYDDVIFIHTISYNGINVAKTTRTEAISYSAGGGGFSSSGGGGGSFGGGGHGGGGVR